MSDILVRKFTIKDLDECVDLYIKTYSEEPWNERWESREIVENFFKNHYANNYFLGYVVVKDERIAGISTGFLKPWINGMEYYIDDFFINVDYHRQGIGSQFMSAIKNELISQGIHAIMLNTERDYPAYKFYESMGFTSAENTVVLYAVF